MKLVPCLPPRRLHRTFLDALTGHVLWHGDVARKPLEVDFLSPLPRRVRLYMYNITSPPGGRTLGEHKIQLIVPGQQRGQRGSFDHSDGRLVLLVGYSAAHKVYVLWDAGMYSDFKYSGNVQVKAETVYRALAGFIATQPRRIRGKGTELVVASVAQGLAEALQLRRQLTIQRLVGD